MGEYMYTLKVMAELRKKNSTVCVGFYDYQYIFTGKVGLVRFSNVAVI